MAPGAPAREPCRPAVSSLRRVGERAQATRNSRLPGLRLGVGKLEQIYSSEFGNKASMGFHFDHGRHSESSVASQQPPVEVTHHDILAVSP